MAFPVDAEYIAATEHRLGVSFPAEFTRRMRQNNGGEAEAGGDWWQLHPFRDASNRKRLSRTSNDIVVETEVARRSSGFPDDAIAIGANGTGNHLVLARAESDPTKLGPEVYEWDHETGRLSVVATSFDQLRFPDPRPMSKPGPRREHRLDRLDARGVVLEQIPKPWRLFQVGKVRVGDYDKQPRWPYVYSTVNYQFRLGKKGRARTVLTKPFENDRWESPAWWGEQFETLFGVRTSPIYGTLAGAETVRPDYDRGLTIVAVKPSVDAAHGLVMNTDIPGLVADLRDLEVLIAALGTSLRQQATGPGPR